MGPPPGVWIFGSPISLSGIGKPPKDGSIGRPQHGQTCMPAPMLGMFPAGGAPIGIPDGGGIGGIPGPGIAGGIGICDIGIGIINLHERSKLYHAATVGRALPLAAGAPAGGGAGPGGGGGGGAFNISLLTSLSLASPQSLIK